MGFNTIYIFQWFYWLFIIIIVIKTLLNTQSCAEKWKQFKFVIFHTRIFKDIKQMVLTKCGLAFNYIQHKVKFIIFENKVKIVCRS